MDRRTFVMTGTWLAGTGCVLSWPWSWPWPSATARPLPALAVFDPTLAHGRALADYASRANLSKFDVGDDIGALWHTTLGPILRHTPAMLIGATRSSDFFVLQQSVPGTARMTQDTCHDRGHTVVRFAIECRPPTART
ncbi:MAG TPA: hypothetical protein VEI25_05105 [Paraburkholderia sp.]|nr:hypothetical protein [Paraburkholderia sp.]